MAFSDAYRESIQNKHIGNVAFTSITKGITNEAFSTKNPHQTLASHIPAVDVLGTYGPLLASGVAAGVVTHYNDVKLTVDPTVSYNKSWYATISGVRYDQWMRYEGTQYKLRLFEDDGTGNAKGTEIFPSEPNFDWEYDASAGVVYFDEDPATAGTGKNLPLWGSFVIYSGETVEDAIGGGGHIHYDLDAAYTSKTLWKVTGSYTTVPDHFIVYVNGVKQRQGVDADISSVYISAGDICIAFDYNVVSNCWVSATFIT